MTNKTRNASSGTLAQLKLLTPENVGTAVRGLPLKAQAALRAAAHLPRGTLTITTPDKRVFKVGGGQTGPDAAVVLHNWNLPRRAFSGGTIGLAESYMDGDWESPDVATFLELFVVNEQVGEDLAGGSNWFMNTVQRLRHWLNENTRTRSRKNISAHYDLGNAFYREWLDPTMTYSSALYGEGANDLESAQTAKYRALARNIGITPGSKVLEIGCGWGGFAEYAAREVGAHVTGLTISREQFEYATQRMQKAGLSDKVEIKFQDYRDEKGKYDHIASIEMFEAVGEKYWPVFFGKVKDCLNPGGSAGMQIITINDKSFDRYRKRPDFIQRYVFPGGMLPTPEKLKNLARTSASISIARMSFRRIMPGRLPNGASGFGVHGTGYGTSALMVASRGFGNFISSIVRRGSVQNISMCARYSINHDNRYIR